MSISLPSFTRVASPPRPRSLRLWAIVATGLRREFRRPAAVATIGIGTALVTITSIIFLFLAPIFLPGQPLDLSFFFLPASNNGVLFFATLMAAVIGGGLIADDLHSMAITLYLSRPITARDYLVAKAAILAAVVSMVSILPLVLTSILAGLFGLFPWEVALTAIAISVPLGLLFMGFYTGFSLFLSSLTRRRGYAAAGIFALTFGLTVPTEILFAAIGDPNLLYVSPWQNYLAVARAAFGAVGGPIDWVPALGILLAITVVASLATYARLRAMEVVTG